MRPRRRRRPDWLGSLLLLVPLFAQHCHAATAQVGSSLLLLPLLARLCRAGTNQITLQDNDPSLSFTGVWATAVGSGFSGGSVTFASGPGASVSTGPRTGVIAMTWISSFSEGAATGSVVLDQNPSVSVSTVRTGTLQGTQHVAFSANSLDPTIPHTLTISYDSTLSPTGSHLDVDAILLVQLDADSLAAALANKTASSTARPTAAPAPSSGSTVVVPAIVGGVGAGLVVVGSVIGFFSIRRCRRRRARESWGHRVRDGRRPELDPVGSFGVDSVTMRQQAPLQPYSIHTLTSQASVVATSTLPPSSSYGSGGRVSAGHDDFQPIARTTYPPPLSQSSGSSRTSSGLNRNGSRTSRRSSGSYPNGSGAPPVPRRPPSSIIPSTQDGSHTEGSTVGFFPNEKRRSPSASYDEHDRPPSYFPSSASGSRR